jgi:hypothetical protein
MSPETKQRSVHWPLWQAALIGMAAGLAYAAIKHFTGAAPPPPPDIHPDAYPYFLAGQWGASATIFGLFAVIAAAVRNFIVSRSDR